MSAALLLARSLLALVFAVAAAGKLASREALRETLADFGLARRPAAVGAIALPVAELVVAGTLIVSSTARFGAFAALGLLAGFCVAIARVLVRGERPDCACFGRLRSAPVGRGTLARNAALAAVAGLVAAVGPGASLGEALAGIDVTPVGVAVGVVSLVVALEGWFGWQLFRQNGRLLERLRTLEASVGDRSPEPAGLPIGAPAPPFDLSDLHGRRRTLQDLLALGRAVALVFSDPGCAACAGLTTRLEHLRDGSLEIALISRSAPAENRRLGGSPLEHVLFQQDREAVEAYRIQVVPSATIVDVHGRIASPTVSGEAAIEELLASHAAPATPQRLRVAAG